jgi:hypothetical protein
MDILDHFFKVFGILFFYMGFVWFGTTRKYFKTEDKE